MQSAEEKVMGNGIHTLFSNEYELEKYIKSTFPKKLELNNRDKILHLISTDKSIIAYQWIYQEVVMDKYHSRYNFNIQIRRDGDFINGLQLINIKEKPIKIFITCNQKTLCDLDPELSCWTFDHIPLILLQYQSCRLHIIWDHDNVDKFMIGFRYGYIHDRKDFVQSKKSFYRTCGMEKFYYKKDEVWTPEQIIKYNEKFPKNIIN